MLVNFKRIGLYILYWLYCLVIVIKLEFLIKDDFFYMFGKLNNIKK